VEKNSKKKVNLTKLKLTKVAENMTPYAFYDKITSTEWNRTMVDQL